MTDVLVQWVTNELDVGLMAFNDVSFESGTVFDYAPELDRSGNAGCDD